MSSESSSYYKYIDFSLSVFGFLHFCYTFPFFHFPFFLFFPVKTGFFRFFCGFPFDLGKFDLGIPHIPNIPNIPHIPELFDLGISSQTGFFSGWGFWHIFLGGVFGTFLRILGFCHRLILACFPCHFDDLNGFLLSWRAFFFFLWARTPIPYTTFICFLFFQILMKNFQFTSLSSRRKSKFSADNVANLDVDSAMTKLLKLLLSVLGDVTSACIKLLSVGRRHFYMYKNYCL